MVRDGTKLIKNKPYHFCAEFLVKYQIHIKRREPMERFKDITLLKKILFNLVLPLCIVALLFGCANKDREYPIEADPLGPGNIKWIETQMPDGWMKVSNEDGATLGYSKNSGLALIQVDGYAFKDLNRNDLLDSFEDWRLDFETRAKTMVDEISTEQMMGMKMNPFGSWTVNADSLDTVIKSSLDLGYRQLRAPVEVGMMQGRRSIGTTWCKSTSRALMLLPVYPRFG